jgi:hypothetical protein
MSPARSDPIRKVVDSNALQSQMLRDYLTRSTSHFAVLTDYAAMEAYKGDTLASIFRSMEILAEFPKQVVVLKTTGVVCGLHGRRAGLQRRMIDTEQTRGFQQYCRALHAAKHGDLRLQQQLMDHGRAANVQMNRMLADAAIMPEAVEGIAKTFTTDELKLIRSESAFHGQLAGKLLKCIVLLSQTLFDRHPQPTNIRTVDELPNTFLFRTALCTFVWALDWIAVGGPKNVKTENIRNDLVDINFASFATYFDGLLSLDQKMIRIYQRAAFVLGAITSRP